MCGSVHQNEIPPLCLFQRWNCDTCSRTSGLRVRTSVQQLRPTCWPDLFLDPTAPSPASLSPVAT
eukprot:gene15063-4491_t